MKEKISELKPDVVEIYSDGACSPNPGKGGCGYAIRYLSPVEFGEPQQERVVSSARGYVDTTNNRMELMGCYLGLCQAEVLIRCLIEGRAVITLASGEIMDGERNPELPIVKRLPYHQVNLVSDSSYLCRGFGSGWVKKWKLSGWKTSTGSPVKNVDMWQAIDRQLERLRTQFGLKSHFICVPGHRGYKFNELCDQLAVRARKGELEADDSPYAYPGGMV